MKIKKIISICKLKKQLILYDDPQRKMQWISDGHCIYPLADMPQFSAQTLCKAHDITESQANKMLLRDHEQLPKIFDYSDCNNFEVEVIKNPIRIIQDGKSVIALETEEGAIFIDSLYLTPLSDYADSDLKIYHRTATNGTTYFAVKFGLILVAIITPIDIVDGKFVENLGWFKNICDAAWWNIRNNVKKNDQVEFSEDETDV